MLPEEFIRYAFEERVEGIKRLLNGKFGPEVLISFTRHNAAIITCGPAGTNGSIKGVGFIHREELLAETIEKMKEELRRPYNPLNAGRFLLEEIYVKERIDFTKLVSLELARKHTWKNLTEGRKEATVLFFTPPSTSYEVRCDVEIHEDGPVWEYANALHDIFHRPKKPRDWSRTPAYLFKIREIYDNGEDKMGVRIYP
ncbi:hypothetical protein [Thermococcus sp. MAR1]|uniref:hypothetical protein n=1 Tax=Thermococcus sp. MAR1 TaxID=1638263 RepID=UPI001438D6D9|nr:hypothetical protein [Thermococcus sp. MAR1]NJE10715.1 hypothetical protein [Thermococcus sp. MAR1]